MDIRVHTDDVYRLRDAAGPALQSARFFNSDNCIEPNKGMYEIAIKKIKNLKATLCYAEKITYNDNFYDIILRLVMYQIGELWDAKKLDVGDEHIASNTAMHLIENIGTKPKARSKGKTILICTPDGEYHAIPCFMMETYFSLNGYDVVNLAPSAPSNSIMNHISEKKPDLILISVTLKDHIKSMQYKMKPLKTL